MIKKKICFDVLLNKSVESFYWVGFILADGHIDGEKGLFSLEISNKDIEHLLKFKYFVSGEQNICKRKDNRNTSSFAFSDKKSGFVAKIAERFDINKNKTTNPPKNEFIFNDNIENIYIFSLVVGFIDGDGGIRKQNNGCYQITLQNHRSWEPFYSSLEDFIGKYFYDNTYSNKNHIRIDCRGYITFDISKQNIIKDMKREVIKLKIPYLKRKWDIIKEDEVGRQDTINKLAKEKRYKALELYKTGFSRTEIAKTMGLSWNSIDNYIFHPERLKSQIE
jgi:hypothetical protein